MTDEHEAMQAMPWAVDDAPDEYTDSMIRGIIGIEITITEIQGKWKMSQNRSEDDRRGVSSGLTALGKDSTAARVAENLND